jgi:hypothetical protein
MRACLFVREQERIKQPWGVDKPSRQLPSQYFFDKCFGIKGDRAVEYAAGDKAPEQRGVGETEHAALNGDLLSQMPYSEHNLNEDGFQKSSTLYGVSPHTLRMNEMARKVSNAASSSMR